jgi:hypothetical protein
VESIEYQLTAVDFVFVLDTLNRHLYFYRESWHELVHLKLVVMLMWLKSERKKIIFKPPHTSEVNLFTFLDKLVGVFCSDGVSDAKPELLLLENFFRFRFSAASAPKCK